MSDIAQILLILRIAGELLEVAQAMSDNVPTQEEIEKLMNEAKTSLDKLKNL
jgi:hypothetical protein